MALVLALVATAFTFISVYIFWGDFYVCPPKSKSLQRRQRG